MRPARSHYLVAAVLLLVTAHLLLGYHSAARFAWLMRRHPVSADLATVRTTVQRFPEIIQEVRERTPSDARIRVCGPEHLALEIAFYAFPRRVVLSSRLADTSPLDATLREAQPGVWDLSTESAQGD